MLGVRDRRQRLGEHIFAGVARLLWGVRDPLCGLKAYRMALYRERQVFDSFRSIGTELAIRSVAHGRSFVERATVIRDRADQPRFARRLSANFKILRALGILLHLGLTGRLGALPEGQKP